MIQIMFKKKVFWLFILSLFFAGFGYYLWKLHECGYSNFCYILFSQVGVGLTYGMIALAVASAAMLFAPKAVSVWAKFSALFALWYVYAIVSSAPRPGMFTNLGMSSADNAIWLSGIYAVVTFGIIAWAYRKVK